MNIAKTLEPKSDQLNAEDLIAGDLTVTIAGVRVYLDAPEQPVVVELHAGFRPYKPCKTMRRVLALAWGAEADHWIGKSIRFYRDPSVKFGGDEVGGIRIRALSHIPHPIREKLASKRGKRDPIHVDVLPPDQIPPVDPIAQARALAAAAKRRGWTNDQIKAAMRGASKIEDMTPEQVGTFLRDLMHAPGTVSAVGEGDAA